MRKFTENVTKFNKITSNVTKITWNVTKITSNVTKITSNVTKITSNVTKITWNVTKITWNVTKNVNKFVKKNIRKFNKNITRCKNPNWLKVFSFCNNFKVGYIIPCFLHHHQSLRMRSFFKLNITKSTKKRDTVHQKSGYWINQKL